MKALIVGSVIALLACFTGCAQQSVRNNIGSASQLDTTALTLAASLAQSGVISSAQLKQVNSVALSVEAALTLAETAANANDQATAQAKYTAALTALTAVTACLQGSATAITSCLAGVENP